jgi:GxxExxY protein
MSARPAALPVKNFPVARQSEPSPQSGKQPSEGHKHKKHFAMQYTLKRLMDTKPELAMQLKQRCYAINGCCAAVHRELGPFLNEYMYQEALQILLDEQQIPYQREYYFSVVFHGRPIQHKHFVDFLVENDIILECKAVDKLVAEHRQQLWNYMRLTGKQIGILYNFAPPMDQCEHYFLDVENGQMFMF